MLLKRENIIIAAISLVLAIAVSLVLLCTFSRFPKDEISGEAESEYHIKGESNYIEYQDLGDGAAYAAAYVMRHFDVDESGDALYDETKNVFGLISVNDVVDIFEERGFDSYAYSGSIDTLKTRLSVGAPIIALIRVKGDMHYVAVVGYDDEYIYLADSLTSFSKTENDWYNRKLKTEEFEKLWETDMYTDENIYIVVNEQ